MSHLTNKKRHVVVLNKVPEIRIQLLDVSNDVRLIYATPWLQLRLPRKSRNHQTYVELSKTVHFHLCHFCFLLFPLEQYCIVNYQAKVVTLSANKLNKKGLKAIQEATATTSTLRQVWMVMGMPNVGKSTFINALLGAEPMEKKKGGVSLKVNVMDMRF